MNKVKQAYNSEAFVQNANLEAQEDHSDLTGTFKKLFKESIKIGEGSYGTVYKATHKVDGKSYAIKRVKCRPFGKITAKQIKDDTLKEINVMKELEHKHIVRYISCWWEKDAQFESDEEEDEDSQENEEEEKIDLRTESQEQRTQELTVSSNSAFAFDRGDNEREESEVTDQKLKSEENSSEQNIRKSKTKRNNWKEGALEDKWSLYIQMELCQQNLQNYLEGNETSILDKLKLFEEALKGVQEIHAKKYLHQDLKPQNIFLNNGFIKIGDFGLTTRLKSKSDQNASEAVGTTLYMSPEQLAKRGPYDEKVDVYSLGLIFYEMIKEFKTSREKYELFTQLRNEHDIPKDFEATYKGESRIILKMTNYYRKYRPSVAEVVAELKCLIGIRQKDSKINRIVYIGKTL